MAMRSGTTRAADVAPGGDMIEGAARAMMKMNEAGLRLSGKMFTLAIEGAAGRIEDAMRLCEKLTSCRTAADLAEAQSAYATDCVERLRREMGMLLEAESAELTAVLTEGRSAAAKSGGETRAAASEAA